MKKLFLLLAFTLPAFAQSNRVYNASTYAYTTQVNGGNPSTGSSSLSASPTAFAQGIPFSPYNTNASITINRNAATAETVTPSSVTNCFPNGAGCTLSSTFTFKHVTGESIQTGTFGLQEAINIAMAAGSGTVLIDASWQGPAGASLITAAVGNNNVLIQDNRNPSGATFYQWNGSAYAATGGGSGTPGGSTTQGQYNNAGAFAGSSAETFRTADGTLSQLANVRYLSAASELGSQCNTAVTALSPGGGTIQLPNSLTLTMTTTCTNIPPNINIRGYGRGGTFITCSVVGDCFQFLQNPTTTGEIGAEIASFGIKGSNTGQTLMHFNGASGYVLRDLQFQPYPGVVGDTAAVCLEFDNSATGLFTERNRTYNVYTERTCTKGVLFNQNAGDSSNSFGYNTFEFGVVSAGANFGVVFNGGATLYGGSLSVTCNHVSTNTGGGCVQFNNTFFTGTSTFPAEQLFISAEENGTGSGTVLSATGSGILSFGPCTLVNGGGGAPFLATNIGGSNIANVFGCSGSTVTGAANLSGAAGDGAIGLNIQGVTTQTYGGIQIDTTGQTGGKKFQFEFFSGGMYFFDVTANTHIAEFVGTTTPFNNQLKVGSASIFGWSSSPQFISAAPDTGLSRDAADAVDCGNGTQGDKTCTLNVGKINVLAARKGTFVCTAGGTITISNANETITSDVVISMNTAGGTITTSPAMKTVTAATGFTVLCGATDTSTYNYDILN